MRCCRHSTEGSDERARDRPSLRKDKGEVSRLPGLFFFVFSF